MGRGSQGPLLFCATRSCPHVLVRVRSCVRSSPLALARVRLCSLSRAGGLFRKNAHFSPKYARACVAKRPELAQRCPSCAKPQVASLDLALPWRVANVPSPLLAYFGEKLEEISRNVSRSRKEAAFANRDARQHAHRIAMLVLTMTASAFHAPTRALNQTRAQKRPATNPPRALASKTLCTRWR